MRTIANFCRAAHGFRMHLRNKGTRGVNLYKPALGAAADVRGYAMHTVDQRRADRHVIDGVNENHAATGEMFDDMPVVHDFP